MKFTLPSLKDHGYSSVVWHYSQIIKGVRYSVRRISLIQRIELTKKTRELALKNEFLKAAEVTDQLEANLADLLIKKLYIEWGLAELKGLTIDGSAATPEMLIERGPEALTDEILTAIRSELELSSEERKNF